ncbi:hypothetical protein [Candidatus Rhabdochlamydia sp. T3358]|uniref:hypothetical protein n=1 Tax=Candidatus Rhabdochlamydia sp. T3358 TaxID=2099795 RepID=UPI0010AFB5B8|nr:hypothetical protein [Candidatus Rhabdochlamydia sp. T3358]VHO05040.1 hypothetical protein RHT_01607 [Candidatus Rhabdochlamydia sp. T3358]
MNLIINLITCLSFITAASLELKNFIPPLEISSAFYTVHSNELIALKGISHRADFIEKLNQGKWELQPVIISQSAFVSKAMTEHLMTNKKDSALGVKYKKGDKITNMEGALHTFVTPICPVTMLGDYIYKKRHGILLLNNMGRRVVLSAAIQPDFELAGNDEVIMKIVEIKQQPVIGQELPSDFQPLWNQSKWNQEVFEKKLKQYEESLQKHLIYFLTKKHRLPALHEVQNIITYQETIELLEQLILKEDVDILEALGDKFSVLNDHVISLEALFTIYTHQLCNEFSVLEHMLPQGYVYTINPPAIFTTQIGGVKNVNLLNRLQILSFKQLKKTSSFENLKVIGFNNYSDKEAINLFRHVFFDKIVVETQALFEQGHYSMKDPYALVLHNNSDAFGQNIETEGPSSLDGVIGSYSDAACHLQRNRENLVRFVM